MESQVRRKKNQQWENTRPMSRGNHWQEGWIQKDYNAALNLSQPNEWFDSQTYYSRKKLNNRLKKVSFFSRVGIKPFNKNLGYKYFNYVGYVVWVVAVSRPKTVCRQIIWLCSNKTSFRKSTDLIWIDSYNALTNDLDWTLT